jgi:hypothetical protein
MGFDEDMTDLKFTYHMVLKFFSHMAMYLLRERWIVYEYATIHSYYMVKIDIICH